MDLNTKEVACDAGYFGPLVIYSVVVNVTYGQLFTIGSTVVYFSIMLFTKLSLARARTHEAWILADNKHLAPKVENLEREIINGRQEREELSRRLDNAEKRIDSKNRTISKLADTNRELSFTVLEKKRVIRRRENETSPSNH